MTDPDAAGGGGEYEVVVGKSLPFKLGFKRKLTHDRIRMDKWCGPLPCWGVWGVPSTSVLSPHSYCRDRGVPWYERDPWKRERNISHQRHDGRWRGSEPDDDKGIRGI